MKKLVASVGLVAIGAAAVQSASAQSVGAPDASKPWSISATLRGFYDDNTATLPNNQSVGPGETRSSAGWEVSPSAALAWAMDQTTISLGYLYSLKYYETRPPNSTGHDDQTHTFNISLSHAFNERFKARVSDSFVVGQEPDFLRAGNSFSTFQRVSGNNIRNYGVVGFDGQLTPLFGVGVGYDNAFYQYENTGAGVNADSTVNPSIGGLLNRMEQAAHVEGLYRVLPETRALIGYRFREIDYNADEYIGGTVINPFLPVSGANLANGVFSSERNSRNHSLYAGAEHNFRPDLTAAVRAGANYTDYYNDPNSNNTWSPMANASVKYTYALESSVEVGFTYDRNAVDVVGATSGDFTRDAESAVVYASLNHRITPKLYGSLMGQFQNSTFSGGAFDNETEQFYLLGVNLEYRFNQFLSAHAGYNYDNLQSDIGRAFDRNRVYIGITASY